MAPGNLTPRILRRREGFQISYTLPQNVYATEVYPRTSSNGSTIIIYAHEQGLTILWYGGRNFKSTSRDTKAKDVNIDLTDDVDELISDFEGENGDADLDEQVKDIIQRHDISLGTGANRLSILRPPTERTAAARPDFFDSHVVVGVACLDQTLRVVTIPLEPQRGPIRDTQVIRIATASAHQDLVSDVAVALTADPTEEDEDEMHPRSRSRTRVTNTEQESDQTSRRWSLLIASTSPTGSGLLLVHQIPFMNDGFSTDPEDHVPIQRRFLRSCLISCRISFNPSPFPSERHSHLLLAIPDGPSVQIYDTVARPESTKRRQGHGNAGDAHGSYPQTARQTSAAGPKSLITMLPGFATSQDAIASPKRKRILDATWIMQGRAVIALLEDGEWGIWDLEAIGPVRSNKSNSLVRGQSNSAGIKGGALTRFALRGTMVGASSQIKGLDSTNKTMSTSELAPMTPHTRKVRSKGLFKGQQQTPTVISQHGSRIEGRISLGTHDLATGGPSQSSDEAVVITYGSSNMLISSIQGYWRSETGGKAALDTIGGGRPILLPNLQTATEEHIASHLLPGIAKSANTTSLVPAFMVSTMSRLILLVPSGLTGIATARSSSYLPMRPAAVKSEAYDQALLESGELDIDGMDRILDNMAQTSADSSMLLNAGDKRQVGFTGSHEDDNDEDEDVDMSTPTAAKSARSKLTIAQEGSARRRLFN